MIIEPLDASDEAGFAGLLALYGDAIEPSEQKTEAALRDMLGRRTSRFLVAREAGEVTGFAILWLPAKADVWSLEYMAVAPARRGEGLGARLFAASVAAARRPFGIIEADAPTGAMQRRRLGFYARLGCRRLGRIDWLLPLRTHGLPPPMWLLVHAEPEVRDVERGRVQGWLGRMYAEIYAQPADDARIAQMLAGADERVELGRI